MNKIEEWVFSVIWLDCITHFALTSFPGEVEMVFGWSPDVIFDLINESLKLMHACMLYFNFML